MNQKRVDIIITTSPKSKERVELFHESILSLTQNTNRDIYNLSIVIDGTDKDNEYAINPMMYDNLLVNRKNLGLGPSLNNAISYVYRLREYTQMNFNNQLICYCQDDIEYSPGWLEKLVKVYDLFQARENIGFVTGHNAPEHTEIQKELRFGKDKLLFKPWIRATQMLTNIHYFYSMLPIPKVDPETGRERGKPNDGLGSGVDWHFIRVHENSVCKTGRTNIVYPGLVKHIGYNKSTWLDRELPEDEY